MNITLDASSFATIAGSTHDAFLNIDGDAPILQVDAQLYELIPIMQQQSIEGSLRAGRRYSCRPVRFHGDMGKTTIAVDDLIVHESFENNQRAAPSDIEHAALFLDPSLIPDLATPPGGTLPYFVHGRAIEVVHLEGMESHEWKTSSRGSPALSIRAVRESELFDGAEREFALSRRESLVLFFKLPKGEPLDTYRKTITAAQLFFEAFLRPKSNYVTAAALNYRRTEGNLSTEVTLADWWSRAILSPPRLPVIGANIMPGGPAESSRYELSARLDEMGGYQALANWCRDCLDLPHVLSALLAYKRNLYLDSEAALISLAVSVEHLTSTLPSSGMNAKNIRLADYVIEHFGCSPRLREMLKLIWSTYTHLKHDRPPSGAAQIGIPERDSQGMRIAAEFAYCLVSAGLLAKVGASLPTSLMLELSDIDANNRYADWQAYLDTHIKQRNNSSGNKA